MDYSWPMSALVFTVLAEDRPGLVERVAGIVACHGGNWLGSRLSSLGGCFGGLVHVAVPAEQVEGLREALQALRAEGLLVTVLPTHMETGTAPHEAVEIEVVGNDRPGIVSRISQVIAARGINVNELETEWTSAPMAGHPIFRARAALLVPPDASVTELKRDLERIAADLMVDLKIGRA
jgi:glycine cleavage system regulatory protein